MKAAAQRPDVVVTGLGFISSIGNDRAAVLDSLKALRHGFEAGSLVAGDASPVRVFGTVKGFSFPSPNYLSWTHPAAYAVPRELKRSLAPHGVYVFCAIEQALAEAGLEPGQLRGEHCGLFCASAGSPMLLHHHVGEMLARGGSRVNPMGVVSSVAGTLNFTLGAHYGIEGANCGFISACASSAHALGYAMDEIRLGRLERVIVAAGEDVTAESLLPFMGMRALSRNPDPAKASRPFDLGRDGFVASGGGVCLVLESEELAGSRGARVLARLQGWGQSADGYSPMIAKPDGSGLARAMRRALADAGLAAGDVDYVNAHATSTPAGDAAEARALRTVFGEEGPGPLVSSTKGLTGHTLSMAGALELALCVLALEEQWVPGNAQLEEVDPACAGLRLPRRSEALPIRRVMSNSSGFGGSNVSLLLERAGPESAGRARRSSSDCGGR